jgi:hypothetical protein
MMDYEGMFYLMIPNGLHKGGLLLARNKNKNKVETSIVTGS